MILNETLITAWMLSNMTTINDIRRQQDAGVIKSFEVRPPIPALKSEPCSLQLLHHQFAHSYGKPYVGRFEVPKCLSKYNSDQVSQIVLTLSGSVSGRQFDRVGGLWIGGSSVLRYTSAEPSGLPLTVWQIEKDITSYANIFMAPQPVVLSLDNVVNEKYTGLFNITIKLDFYFDTTNSEQKPVIIPISHSTNSYGWYQLDTEGYHTFKEQVPENIVKAELEVFISGHGKDEFWYGNDPELDMPDIGIYKGGPFKELQIFLNDNLVSVDPIIPTIYTGGFNPLLWRPAVAM